MLKEDIKERVREKLLQDLGREPLEEEVEAEIGDWREYKEGQKFIVGLHRRFTNRNLQKAIQEKGFTYQKLQELCGIGLNTLSRIVNFKFKPTEEQKVKLAVALEIPVEKIFPEKYDELYDKISPLPVKTEVEIKMVALDSPEVLRLQSPDNYFRKIEAKIDFQNRIGKFLHELSPKEEALIRYRFGFDDGVSHTLEEAGKYFGVTHERIRQIEAKALGRLRTGIEKNKIKEKEIKRIWTKNRTNKKN